MPWVRIDEKAMDHPKIMRLSDGAFRLWVAGLAYCQKHLTDGAIPREALKLLPAMTRGRVGELVSGGMWEQVELGFQVHHYLEWNDSRDHVTKAREDAKTRFHRHKEKRVADMPLATRYTSLHNTPRVLKEPEPERARTCESQDEVAERAARFLERYSDLHQKYRSGAAYVGKMHLDFMEAKQLVSVYDDERLDKLAIVFLNADDEFSSNGTRTLAKFRSRASWCDERLRQKGL
jgi:hypothetical protein